jgi:murein DD-endopeptidase MepM/ murein hydrolase activator NlpD
MAVEWVGPGGDTVWSADYGALPAVRTLCFVNALPLAGYEWGSRGGMWRVRIRVGGVSAWEGTFRVEAPAAGSVVIQGVERRERELVVKGLGFTPETTLYLARLDRGRWVYEQSFRLYDGARGDVVVPVKALAPGEYFLIGRNSGYPEGPAFPFAVASGGFRLPIPAGVPWAVTQGPNGGFSHYSRTRYAYDLAPIGDACVVAMRAGTVIARDLGLGNTLNQRIFGNSITIDHGDGYFSHYAHLRTGTFVVKTGQRVEQGQALALAGNSGYSFGTHLHVQVTREAAIASQSIPFAFEDAPGAGKGRVVSRNESRLCECGRPQQAGGRLGTTGLGTTGSVAEGGWHHELITVPAGLAVWEVRLEWEGASELDLHLMSPVGEHFGSGGRVSGYSGERSRPETIRVERPVGGTWRISVRGRQVAGVQGFQVAAGAPLARGGR